MIRILCILSYPTCIHFKRSCQNPNHLFQAILSVDSADSSMDIIFLVDVSVAALRCLKVQGFCV